MLPNLLACYNRLCKLSPFLFSKILKIFKAYKFGWQFLLRHWRLLIMLYIVNFVFALLAAFPLNNYLQSTVAHTLSVQESLEGFNYGIISDFLNEYGTGLAVVFNQSLVVILFFFVLNIFFAGGILNLIKYQPAKYDSSTFWSGCTKYFWRIFRLTIYFLITHGMLLFICYTIFMKVSGGFDFFEMENDQQIVTGLKIALPIYLLLAFFVFLFNDYFKLHIVDYEKKYLFKPFTSNLKFLSKNILPTAILYLINMLVFAVVFLIFYFITRAMGAQTYLGIFLLFIVNQVWVILKTSVKLINLSSAGYLYQYRKVDEELA